jgi:hypothetical protein
MAITTTSLTSKMLKASGQRRRMEVPLEERCFMRYKLDHCGSLRGTGDARRANRAKDLLVPSTIIIRADDIIE